MKMQKVIGLLLAVCLIIGCCGCDNTATAKPVIAGGEGAQYVIALNPSLSFEDTTVSSIRNSVSDSLQKDMSENKAESLYENTPWRWLTHKQTGEWHVRKLRGVSIWRAADSFSKNGAPYSYIVTDSGISSLAVFDSTKMDVKGVNEGEIPQSGVLMSFTGEEEEGITYVADKDCVAKLSDRDGSNVAVVSSIAGVNTDFTKQENAKIAVVVRIYKNNRIYWQEVLEADTTAVPLPTFTNLELKIGDTISITAQAMDDTSAIIRGNCDLPATSTIITEKVSVETQVEKAEKEVGIPLVNKDGQSNFTIVRPKDLSTEENTILMALSSNIRNKTGLYVDVVNDESFVEGNRIILYKTKLDESKKVLQEIKKNRSKNVADFIIRLVGNDVVIAADTEIGLEYAIDFFMDNYCKSSEDIIPFGLNYVSSNYNALKEVSLAGAPISDYRVVVSSYAAFIETNAAKTFVKEIARIAGVKLDIVRDAHSAAQGKEIAIGNTNRANYTNSADYTNTTYNKADKTFKISVDKNLTTILGSHVYGANAGVMEMISIIEKTPALKNGYKFEGEYDGDYSLSNGYKLTWGDDFDGDSLSPTWLLSCHLGDVRDNEYGGITRTTKPLFREGAMVMPIIKQGNDFYDLEIQSKGINSMYFMYGYLEIRLKFAISQGCATSFWTKGEVAGGFLECDIFENFGRPTNVKHNMHIWKTGEHKNLLGGVGSTLNVSPGTTSPEPYGYRYHTVGWEWHDDYSVFYVDGQPTISYDHSTSMYDVFDKPAYVLVENVASTSDYGATVLPDFTYDEVLVDYVHIYQQNDGSVMYVKS